MVSAHSKHSFWKLPEALPMSEVGSERKLSSGSETVIGDDDDDGFVNVRASSLSLLLAISL